MTEHSGTLTVFDANTGKEITVYKPGDRVFARLELPDGQTLGELGKRKHFELKLTVKGEGTREYSRSISFYKEKGERDLVDMSSSTVEFPLIVDPRKNRTLGSPSQIQNATTLLSALNVIEKPGTYDAVLSMDIDTIDDGPTTEFKVEFADDDALKERDEIIKLYEILLPVHPTPDRQHITFLDGSTMEEVDVYKPGMHLIARLNAKDGTTIGELCEQTGGFDFSLKLLAPDLTRWAREITFGPDTPGFDASATTMDVDILVNPETFQPKDKDHRKRTLKYGETLQVLDAPGMYDAVVEVNRGAMYEAHIYMDLTTPEAMTKMKEIATSYSSIAEVSEPEPEPEPEKASLASQTSIALWNPATKEDVTTYVPGMSLKMEIKPPDGKPFKELVPEANPESLELIVTLKAFDGDNEVAKWSTTVPGLAEVDSTNLNIWRDPGYTEMEDWPETVEFKQYVFGQLQEPKAYELVFESVFKAGYDQAELPPASIIWDVSGANFANWELILSGKSPAEAAQNDFSEAGMVDPEVEAGIKKAIQSQGIEPLKIVITRKKWIVEREDGIVQNRTIWAEFAKKTDDGSYVINEICCKQEFIGNEWDELRYFSWGTRNDYITEDKLDLSAAPENVNTDNRLRPPMMSDPEIEADMKKVLQDMGIEPVKLIIINDRWFEQNHPETGELQLRVIFGEFAAKDKGDLYVIRDVCFKQDFVDGKFGPTHFLQWGKRQDYTVEANLS